jgi:hypothetical protein
LFDPVCGEEGAHVVLVGHARDFFDKNDAELGLDLVIISHGLNIRKPKYRLDHSDIFLRIKAVF